MHYKKRAIKSNLRNPGKSGTMLLLIVLLAAVISIAISMSNAIDNTNSNLRRRMRPVVSIDFDLVAWNYSHDIPHWNTWNWDDSDFSPLRAPNPPFLTFEQMHAIGALPYVHFYDHTIWDSFNSFELVYSGGTTWPFPQGIPYRIRTEGTSRTDIVKFEIGVNELVSGRLFTSDELIRNETGKTVAVVSEQFATRNNLYIGAVFELYKFVRHPVESELEGFTINYFAQHFI